MHLTLSDQLLLLLAPLVLFWLASRLLVWTYRAGWSRAQQVKVAGASLLLFASWLVFTSVLALNGFLRQWQALPPHLLAVLLPPMVLAFFLLRSRRVGELLDTLPLWTLVAPQVFRVGVEALLWLLYREGRIPVQMTFEGRNFDVVVGLTALPVAWWLARNPSPTVARFWNGIGLLILANIVVVAILSAPLPIRQFHNEPANTVIAEWPWVWLPGVLVPVAYLLHLLALRQVARRVQAGHPVEPA